MRILAQHLLRAVDDVLEDLVERVADMDVAIGIRRAVMQHEFGLALGTGAQLAIEVARSPRFQDRRFLLRQIAAHGKVGLRQEDGVLVIGLRGLGGHDRYPTLQNCYGWRECPGKCPGAGPW
jgi:hypothetical protein